jgi:hypothetical protein
MFGTQDGQLCAGNIGGGKKGNPLNVIPVCMAQEQVRVYRAWLRQQRLTQSPDARASVKDDERVVIEAALRHRKYCHRSAWWWALVRLWTRVSPRT